MTADPTRLPADSSGLPTVTGETWTRPPLPPSSSLPYRRGRRGRPWLNVALFLLTVVSTTAIGAVHYAGFASDFGRVDAELRWLPGLWYSGTILAILGCHELGHYFACRYYDVDASLPYFLPAPILTGTLGAFIRIREPIRSKPVLFDVGVAGPIAGFAVAVPALFAGLALSHVSRLPGDFTGLELGEPLLFRFASWALFGPTPEGWSVNLHPMAFAAWFGLLATALNLFPIGQLDGGHISYAVLGRRSTWITAGTMGLAVLLTVFSTSWLVWTVLLALMLVAFGPRHPRTLDEHVPLDWGRRLVALFALFMLVVCFTPAPIEVIELLPR